MADGKVTIDIILDENGAVKGIKGLEESLGGVGEKAKSVGGSFKGMLAGLGVFKLVSGAVSLVSDSIGGAIKRFDTLNNSTRVFENMGFAAKDTDAMMENLNNSISGLPTPIDSAISSVQLLVGSVGDLDRSQEIFAALNNGILGFGGSTEQVENTVTQLSQAFSNGKVDAETWNSMIDSGLGPTLNALAKQMGMTTGEMKSSLSDGTISVESFQDSLIKLNKEGGGGLVSLEKIAQDSTAGIGTGFANAKTAVTRGVEGIIAAIDEALAGANLGGIGGVIAAIGSGFESALSSVSAFVPVIGQVFATIAGSTAFQSLIEVIGLVIDKFTSMSSSFMESQAFENLKNAAMELAEAILSIDFVAVVKEVGSLVDKWAPLIVGITGAIVAFQAISTIVPIVTAAFAGFKILVTLVKTVGLIQTAFTLLAPIIGAISWPIVAVAAVIGVLIAAGVALYQNWDTVKAKAIEVWTAISDFFSGVWTSTVELGKSVWASLSEFFSGLWTSISEGAISIWTSISTFFSDLWTSITMAAQAAWSSFTAMLSSVWANILAVATPVFTAIGSFISTIWDGIKIATEFVWNIIKGIIFVVVGAVAIFIMTMFNGIKNIVTTVWNAVSTVTSTVWAAISAVVINIVTVIWTYISNIFNQIAAFVTVIWTAIATFISTTWTTIYTTVSTWIQQVWAVVSAVFNQVAAFVTTIWTSISTFISTTWNAIYTTVSSWLSQVWAVVSSIFNQVAAFVSSVWAAISNVITTAWSKIYNAVSSAVNRVMSVVSSVFNAVKNVITNIWNSVSSTTVSIWNTIRNAVSNAVNAVKSVITSVFNAVKSVISNVWNSVKSTTSSVWNSIKSTISNILNNIKSTFSNIFDSLKSTVTNAFNNVVSAVGSGMSSAYNKVKEYITKFYDAGQNIIGSIVDGIKSKVSAVTDAVGNVANTIRDFFPFSPAKRGPLKKLHKVDFGWAITTAIGKSKNKVNNAMNDLVEIPDLNSVNGLGSTLNGRISLPRTSKAMPTLNNPSFGSGGYTGQNSSKTIQNDNGVTIHIEKIENNTDQDIPQALEEAAWIIDRERKRLDG